MNAPQSVATRDDNPLVQLRGQLAQRAEEFKAVLPTHIAPDRFQRTVLTAVQASPSLLQADRRSFITSCFKAAQDGLLPDGREAALVVYSTRRKGPNGWETVKQVSYLPMVYGLRKKILQSEEIVDIFAAVVYRQEIDAKRFIYEEGTERQLRHKPLLDPDFDPSDDDIALAYSVATFKDGSKSFEVMRRSEINKVRQASQTGAEGRVARYDGERHGLKKGDPIPPEGPWVDWFSEMAKKSVIRRHSKSLPMSGDVLIDVEGQEHEAAANESTVAALAMPGGQPEALPEPETFDSETGEVFEGQATHDPQPTDGQGSFSDEREEAEPQRRKRRTKAEMDAARAEEAKAAGGTDKPAEGERGNAPAPAATEATSAAGASMGNGETTSSNGPTATTSASRSEAPKPAAAPAPEPDPSPAAHPQQAPEPQVAPQPAPVAPAEQPVAAPEPQVDEQTGITKSPGEQLADDTLRAFVNAEFIIDVQRAWIAVEPHLTAMEPEVVDTLKREYNAARVRMGGKPVEV